MGYSQQSTILTSSKALKKFIRHDSDYNYHLLHGKNVFRVIIAKLFNVLWHADKKPVFITYPRPGTKIKMHRTIAEYQYFQQ